ncbi:transposable element Tc1 transposase [Trichonephila clavata]|uniref:Transposable element Tc1 transposase n=1 Tax=Trichonephila clavata TaxID=2740835 RepID=A0A8X6GEV6_TRICU|nr:transposable element Tc1 transposase [Trichonephila clavata]
MTRDSDKKENEAEVKIEANKEAKLKAERSNLRRLFTVAANSFDDIHRSMNREKNIDIQFSKIYEKAERLFKVDQEIKEIINFTDEEYTMESYRDRFTEIRVIYKKNYNKHDESKSEISKDKFQYLLSSLKPRTKARDIAESYPPSKGNYLKVIDHLKSRFGRKDLLIEVYIRDLLALVNNKSAIKLTDLYDKLGSNLRSLETLNVTTSNYAAMLFPVVESCLPAEVLKAWGRHRLNREVPEDLALGKEKVLENLMTFLRHEVEGEERRILAENGFGSKTNRKESHKQVQRDEPTATTLVANTSARKICCVFCDRSHPGKDCQKLSAMNYEDRKSQVMRKRCYLVCLKPGHMEKKCHSNVKCLISERRHCALLCPDLRKDMNSYSKGKVAEEEQKSTEVLLTNLPSEREIY